MNIIIYDFEILPKGTLLGAIVLSDQEEKYQLWDVEEIRNFYKEHENDLWIGWNNWNYDDIVLSAIVEGLDPYQTSLGIVNKNINYKNKLDFLSFDLMNSANEKISLKLTELICGKSIETTKVDFTYQGEIDEEKKELLETYNYADLLQTKYNFEKFSNRLKLRIELSKDFDIPLRDALRFTDNQLSAKIFNVKRDLSLKYRAIERKVPSTLKLDNKDLEKAFLCKYTDSGNVTYNIANASLQLGIGGLHFAEPQCFTLKALYLDVSGYYNLLLILYNLFPRCFSEEGKAKYKELYYKQLEMKKTNPGKREILKRMLLSPTGAMNSEYSDFYDPNMYVELTATGQMFIIDLMEKLKDKVKFVNVNTDGLIVLPNKWEELETILSIVDEWEKRTGFVIKKQYIYNLYQRDVNYYFFNTEEGEIKTIGIKNFDISDKAYEEAKIFNCKEPPIIAQGLINYYINGIDPNDYVNEHREDLVLFQYPCKKGSYDYLVYQYFEDGLLKEEKLEPIVRCFASNSTRVYGTILKRKDHSKSRVSNLPDNVFVYNGNLEDNKQEIISKIDYNYYVDRIKSKFKEFLR